MLASHTLVRAAIALAVVGLSATDLFAQPLGTFRWQLSPFCNVLTLNVTQKGTLFTLDGIDDQCGTGPASVVGGAFFNPDASVGMGLTLVVSPVAPVHLTVALNTATLSGTWTDSAGFSGAFAFNPALPAPGSPRPSAGLGARVNTNTAVGAEALLSRTSGLGNTAVGTQALAASTTGATNVAIGARALFANTAGNANSAFGWSALLNLTSGSRNLALGQSAGSILETGSDNIYIRNGGTVNESETMRIGTVTRSFIAGIRGTITGANDATAVVIDSFGQLGTISSTRRVKEDIEDLGAVARQVLALRPVQFRYTKPFANGSKPVQYGLIAEEVADVLPELVAHDQNGEPASVKYHILPTLLLAEVQRLERERASLQNQLEAETTAREAQAARIDALTRDLAALAAKLEASPRP